MIGRIDVNRIKVIATFCEDKSPKIVIRMQNKPKIKNSPEYL